MVFKVLELINIKMPEMMRVVTNSKAYSLISSLTILVLDVMLSKFLRNTKVERESTEVRIESVSVAGYSFDILEAFYVRVIYHYQIQDLLCVARRGNHHVLLLH